MSDLKEREIGALWVKYGKNNNKYYTGAINGQRVVMFDTGDGGVKPSYKIYKEQERDI